MNDAMQKPVGWKVKLSAFVLWVVTRLLLLTVRVKTVYSERLTQARSTGKPLLYAFWHGRQLALFKANPECQMAVLSSFSRDGEMQARICRRFGFQVVRGSSSRGGLAGLMRLGRCVRSGFSIGLAVDGPKGPAFEAKPGIVALSRRSGAPILPVTAGFRRAFTFRRAWDEFQLPMPFTTAVVAFGEPILVGNNVSVSEQLRLTSALTESLRTLTSEVDGGWKN
jgi:lysophospholipid acyltransferase (LPLAT)-like uncharacterized protein